MKFEICNVHKIPSSAYLFLAIYHRLIRRRVLRLSCADLAKLTYTMHVIADLFRDRATRQTPGHPDANNVELSLLARLRTSHQYQSSHVERRTLGAWCLTTRLIELVGDNHAVRSIV